MFYSLGLCLEVRRLGIRVRDCSLWLIRYG